MSESDVHRGAQGSQLHAESSVRDWLADPRGKAALAAALAAAGLSLDTVRPLSGFTLQAVAALVGNALSPVDDFVARAQSFVVSEDPGAPTHWATTGLGRQPSNRKSV